MRVYNLSPASYALQNLQRHRLKVSTFEDLNDPFELLSMKLPSQAMREGLQQFKVDMHSSTGILCFTRCWDNPVMWSHYADKHRGVCLGFDIPDDRAVRVRYVAARTTLKFRDNLERKGVDQTFALDLMRSKYKDWRYEKEVRMFVGLDETEKSVDGLYFYGFDEFLVLKEVILGPRCDGLVAKDIKATLATIQPAVSLIQARLSFRTFRVVVRQASADLP